MDRASVSKTDKCFDLLRPAATATTRNELLCDYKKKRSWGTSKNELFLGVGVENSLLSIGIDIGVGVGIWNRC